MTGEGRNIMNHTIQALLEGRVENHILPFLWQHGEDEETLRRMMGAVHGAGCVTFIFKVFKDL